MSNVKKEELSQRWHRGGASEVSGRRPPPRRSDPRAAPLPAALVGRPSLWTGWVKLKSAVWTGRGGAQRCSSEPDPEGRLVNRRRSSAAALSRRASHTFADAPPLAAAGAAPSVIPIGWGSDAAEIRCSRWSRVRGQGCRVAPESLWWPSP